MSTKAENTSRYSSQQSWWQFLIRHPLLLKVVTWLSSLSLLANASVSWAEVQSIKISSQSPAPALLQSATLPIISSSQPAFGQPAAQVNNAHRKLHADLLVAKNFTVAVQSAPAAPKNADSTGIICNRATNQLVSSLCSQVRPQSQKEKGAVKTPLAFKPSALPVVQPIPVVNSAPSLSKPNASKSWARTRSVQAPAPKTLAPQVIAKLAKPQPLAPLAIPGAVSIFVAPPQTNAIPQRPVEPLRAIPTVSRLSVPSLAPIPVVQPPRPAMQVAQNNVNPSAAEPIVNYQVADGLIYPLASPAPMTSRFGWRIHPITGNRRFHAGVDLGAPTGAAVVAAATGRVTVANWHGGYGKTVVIEHNGKLQTLYGHLSEILVQDGQEVTQGTVIGRVGSTGNSTGPHLHFETHAATSDGWVAIDPGPEVRYALDNLRQAMQYARRNG